MILRLSISDTEYFDAEVKPFHELTTSEFIRLAEEHERLEDTDDLRKAMVTIHRFTGAPMEFVYAASAEQASEILRLIHEQVYGRDNVMERMNGVDKALKSWEQDHEGVGYTATDAQALMEGAAIFRDRIEIDGRTFTAPDPEQAPFGKWVDLNSAMDQHNAAKGTESEAYVAALSAMMVGDDGPFPVQRTDESDEDYNLRCGAYMGDRRELFLQAKWVDVMGCAAFFFSKSQRFAGLTAASMSRFRNFLPHNPKPVLRLIPSVGASTSN